MLEEDPPIVRAAGGMVWRKTSPGGVEVVVVHRPKYDDWTFPKGKREMGEDDETCALREVEEETGLRCSLGPELPPASYTDHRGRPKKVRYWTMSVIDESVIVEPEFAPNAEVDELRWCDRDQAAALLSYDVDQAVLASFFPV